MTFRELERIVTTDGWMRKASIGSHIQYNHPTKPGKVTIPNHRGDLKPAVVHSVLKQARLK